MYFRFWTTQLFVQLKEACSNVITLLCTKKFSPNQWNYDTSNIFSAGIDHCSSEWIPLYYSFLTYASRCYYNLFVFHLSFKKYNFFYQTVQKRILVSIQINCFQRLYSNLKSFFAVSKKMLVINWFLVIVVDPMEELEIVCFVIQNSDHYQM